MCLYEAAGLQESKLEAGRPTEALPRKSQSLLPHLVGHALTLPLDGRGGGALAPGARCARWDGRTLWPCFPGSHRQNPGAELPAGALVSSSHPLGPVASRPSPGIARLANFSHANLDTCLLVSHWALIWFCLTTHEAEHLFVCLLAIRGWGRT